MDPNKMFDAPIPGQSLTSEPGAMPYEKPPQFVKPEEAIEWMFDRMTTPKMAIKILALLESGASVEEVTRTLLFAGFAEGKWTPDVMLLISKPVMGMIFALGKRAGLDVKMRRGNKAPDDAVRKLVRSKWKDAPEEEAEAVVEDVAPAPTQPPAGGLMSPRGVK